MKHVLTSPTNGESQLGASPKRLMFFSVLVVIAIVNIVIAAVFNFVIVSQKNEDEDERTIGLADSRPACELEERTWAEGE